MTRPFFICMKDITAQASQEHDAIVGQLKTGIDVCCPLLRTLEMWPRIKAPRGARQWSRSPFSSISLHLELLPLCLNRTAAERWKIWPSYEEKSQREGSPLWTRMSVSVSVEASAVRCEDTDSHAAPAPRALAPSDPVRSCYHHPFPTPTLGCLKRSHRDIAADHIVTLNARGDSCSLIYPSLSTPSNLAGHSQASHVTLRPLAASVTNYIMYLYMSSFICISYIFTRLHLFKKSM